MQYNFAWFILRLVFPSYPLPHPFLICFLKVFLKFLCRVLKISPDHMPLAAAKLLWTIKPVVICRKTKVQRNLGWVEHQGLVKYLARQTYIQLQSLNHRNSFSPPYFFLLFPPRFLPSIIRITPLFLRTWKHEVLLSLAPFLQVTLQCVGQHSISLSNWAARMAGGGQRRVVKSAYFLMESQQCISWEVSTQRVNNSKLVLWQQESI